MTSKKQYEHILTKEFLEKEYIENKKSCRQIGKELNINHSIISSYLKLYKINIRSKAVEILCGTKFNKLTAIKIVGKNKNRSNLWLCKCECGNTSVVEANHLKNNHSKSCGCLNNSSKPKGLNSKLWKGLGNISGSFWCNIKYGAKNRNINFNITIEQAWEIFEKQEGKCYLSGLDLSFNEYYGSRLGTASLDRINNSLGYEVDNIGWTHKNINKMKLMLSNKEFIIYCGLVANFDGVFKKSDNNLIIHKNYMYTIKSNAKKRGIKYELFEKQLAEKFNNQGGICAFTGLDLVFPNYNSSYYNFLHTASLDRIDNSLGYTFENIQWVHKQINASRANLSIEKYKEFCNLIFCHSR